MPARRNEAVRVRRFFAVAVLAFAVAAPPAPGAAIVPATPAPSASPSPTAAPSGRRDANLAFVQGSADVSIKASRSYDAQDDAVSSNGLEVLVVHLTWTNDTGLDIVPRVDRFEFVDAIARQYAGVDTGDVALIGISNYAGVVKRGESHDYTIGFRVPQNVAGRIIYDTSI